MAETSKPVVHRTKFIYDERGKAIGRVDDRGVIYTLALNESQPYYMTNLGWAVNKSHTKRQWHTDDNLS